MAQAQAVQHSRKAMTEMEQIWNRPMAAGQAMPSVESLDQAMKEPGMTAPRKQMLQQMREYSALMESGVVTTPKAEASMALTVRELSGEELELVLGLTRRALQRSGLGQFALAMLEGLLTDHPKVVLKLIQDPSQPTLIAMDPLFQKLMALDETMDSQFLLILGRMNEKMLSHRSGSSDPMDSVRAANAARMAATEQVMDLIGKKLESSNPLL